MIIGTALFCKVLCMPCCCGEIGRRKGLKIPRWQHRTLSLIHIFAKIGLEKLRRPAVRWASKFALFNACVLSMYAIILFVFPLPAVVLEFEGMGQVFIFFLLALANLTFLLYDKAIERLTALYCCKIRNKLLR